MLTLASIVQLALMLVAPVAFVICLRRARWGSWPAIGAGAFAWMASQAVHLPLNRGLEMADVLGRGGPNVYVQIAVLATTAGLCEEPARWLVLTFLAKRARTHRDAVAFGAGHGGVEAVFFGLLAASAFLQMIAARDNPAVLGLDAAQTRAVAAFWASPWWTPLLGGVERILAITFHVSATCLVMTAVVRRAPWILLVSIAWHAFGNFVAVAALQAWGALASEGALLLCVPISLAIIFLSRRWIDGAPASRAAALAAS